MIRRAFLYYQLAKPHQVRAMNELSRGLMAAGWYATVSDSWADVGGAEFVVSWGDHVPAELADRPRLILESTHFTAAGADYAANRIAYVSISWDGMHGQARTPDWNYSGWRAQALGLIERVRPWRDGGAYVLLLGQYPTDQSAPSSSDWNAIIAAVRARGWPYKIRPHPLVALREGRAPASSLADDLEAARLAVTWSSTAAVESVLAGVPTVTLHRSAIAWPVTSHSFSDRPYQGDRYEWLYNLAWRNFHFAELADPAMVAEILAQGGFGESQQTCIA